MTDLEFQDVHQLAKGAVAEIERLRAALDKIIGVTLGCHQDPDFPAAKVHGIAMRALEHASEQCAPGNESKSNDRT